MACFALQYALRETLRVIKEPRVIIGLLTACVVFGLSGPFGTFHALPTLARLAYWFLLLNVAFCVSTFFTFLPEYHVRTLNLDLQVQRAINALASAIPPTLFIVLLNWLIFSDDPRTARHLWLMFFAIFLISVLIGYVFQVFDKETAKGHAALNDRLPGEKRGALVSLSVQDHYVNVSTIKGSELVLMRLSDAIKETHTVNGMQVHRSHWVNLDQIAEARREKDRVIVSMRNGDEIPVSRSYIKELQARGITPRPSKLH